MPVGCKQVCVFFFKLVFFSLHMNQCSLMRRYNLFLNENAHCIIFVFKHRRLNWRTVFLVTHTKGIE